MLCTRRNSVPPSKKCRTGLRRIAMSWERSMRTVSNHCAVKDSSFKSCPIPRGRSRRHLPFRARERALEHAFERKNPPGACRRRPTSTDRNSSSCGWKGPLLEQWREELASRGVELMENFLQARIRRGWSPHRWGPVAQLPFVARVQLFGTEDTGPDLMSRSMRAAAPADWRGCACAGRRNSKLPSRFRESGHDQHRSQSHSTSHGAPLCR